MEIARDLGEMNEVPEGNVHARRPPIRKSLGQHFLSDPGILRRIADGLELRPEETVIEIGPGRGSLTEQLVQRAGRVIAVELDRALAAALRERYRDNANVTIVEADVLASPLGHLATGDFALAGNLPYYITTPILFHALAPPRPSRAVYLVQREVAERMVAMPGTKEYGALTVNLQALATVEMLFKVSRGAFHPPPRVDSAVVRVRPRDASLIARAEEAPFRAFVQEAFALRRKQMRRVLRTMRSLSAGQSNEILERCRIDPEARPETLAPEQFVALMRRVGIRD